MNESLYIFLLTGVFSMSAALSVGAINKMPESDRPAWFAVKQNMVMMVVLGNLAALTLVGSLAYGFQTLHWSIPLSSMFITFPIVHQLLVVKMIGATKALFITFPATLASIAVLYIYWP
jgi:hypothetical protein